MVRCRLKIQGQQAGKAFQALGFWKEIVSPRCSTAVLFSVEISPADWESRVESWMPNEAWKATTRTSGRFSAWEVAQSEVQTGDRMLFNNKILIASKVRGGGRKVSQPQIAAGKEKNFNAINEISADQGM